MTDTDRERHYEHPEHTSAHEAFAQARAERGDPRDKTEPEVFNAGPQPTAEEVAAPDPEPQVWRQKSADGGEVVGGGDIDPPDGDTPTGTPE